MCRIWRGIYINYRNYFGISPWHFYTCQKPFVPHLTIPGKPAVYYAMHIALANLEPTCIELIEQAAEKTVYADFIEKHRYGIQHLGGLAIDMKVSWS
ncbi:MAG: VOC family protein [Spirochaetales bacterium]|nr:VOC family protein [Spirochaetales bacterium]